MLVLALAVRPARAQDAGVTTAALAPEDFFIGVQRENGINLTDFEIERFFNLANCQCNVPVFLFFTLLPTGFAKRGSTPTGNIDFWIGSNCSDQTQRALGKCDLLESQQLTTFLSNGKETVATTAQVISTNTALTTIDQDGGVVTTPTVGVFTPNTSCTATTQKFAQTIFALVDYGADGIYDLSVTRSVNVRLIPPPGPAAATVGQGNQALIVNWTQVDTTQFPDLQGYQILCARAGDLQVFADGTFPPAFETCPSAVTGTGIESLNPLFTCSPLLSRLTTSFRVAILQNDIIYAVGVSSVDISFNASVPVPLYDSPVKTLSFYDVYRTPNINGTTGQPEEGGKAAGGFCNVGGRGSLGSAATAGLALLAVGAAIVLAARRRRRP
jgi:hypothetical protein